MPQRVSGNGQEIQYLERADVAENAEVTSVELPVGGSGLEAEVLLAGSVGDVEGALVTQNGNRYFINGSRLDSDVAYILSDLLGIAACLLGPGVYWNTVGPNISAFLGFEDGQNVRVRLPLTEGTKVSVYRRNGQGRTSEQAITYSVAGGFSSPIDKGEIIVLTLP